MPIPKKTLDLLKRSEAFRNTTSDALLTGLSRVENTAISTILNRLREMSSGPDGLRLSNANAAKLNKLAKDLLKIIQSPTYVKRGRAYLRAFNELDDITAATYKSMGVGADKTLWSDIKGSSLTYFESLLLGKGFESAVTDPLMNRISNLVLSGGDFGHIEQELRGFFSGPDGLARHLNQVSVDTINQYNGAVHERIGKKFKLNWGMYVGSIIATSRPQCVRWVEKEFLHRSELEREIQWAFGNGGGMIRPTTASTFSQNRGGYRCRHEFIWVSDEIVPEGVRERVE